MEKIEIKDQKSAIDYAKGLGELSLQEQLQLACYFLASTDLKTRVGEVVISLCLVTEGRLEEAKKDCASEFGELKRLASAALPVFSIITAQLQEIAKAIAKAEGGEQ